MFSKHESYDTNMFVNGIEVVKNVSTNVSAYDRVVQIVTNDNHEITPEGEAKKSTYDYLNNCFC